jgi:low molecular weight phosphotyrosine protein phosphatase
MADQDQQLSVLFVCLGNICRSTMAEGVFQALARKPPYEELVGKVDSCGTGLPHPHPRRKPIST